MKQYHDHPFVLKEFKIEVTYRCELNCIHCSSDARPSNVNEMFISDYLRIVSEASALGTRKVALSGGEPLLWVHIFEAVETAVNHRVDVTVYTSGNTEGFKTKAEKLYRVGASRFIFSIFGGTAATHERMTRKSGSFDRTKNAIKEAFSIGLKPELHFVPTAF